LFIIIIIFLIYQKLPLSVGFDIPFDNAGMLRHQISDLITLLSIDLITLIINH